MKFSHIVKIETNVRSFADRRKRCNRIIFALIGDDGHEYRRKVELSRKFELTPTVAENYAFGAVEAGWFDQPQTQEKEQ